MASIDTTSTTIPSIIAKASSSATNDAAKTDSLILFKAKIDTSCPDEIGQPLVENADAKEKAKRKVSQAIELIKKNAPLYHSNGYGPDFSEELRKLGEENIEVTPTKKNRSMADAIYKENSEIQNSPSAKTNGNLFSSSKIYVHYNNYDVYNASSEEIAATIVHELGHLQDKDNISSFQEEKDVETQSRNFGAFIKKPEEFKFNPKPNGIECFSSLYKDKKNFGDFSPHHGM